MAKPYKPGPKRFRFEAADGTDESVLVADAQAAYEALRGFVEHHSSDRYTVRDDTTAETLDLLTGRCVLTRHHVTGGPRTDHLEVARAARCLTGAMLFFENGHAGLDHFGSWVDDLAVLDEAPEVQGARRAASFTTQEAALAELGRLWADSGIVDPSDRFCVFFDSHGADDDLVERVVLLQLIPFLGLERVEAPAGAADGEVWVRRDPRLDAEIERWA